MQTPPLSEANVALLVNANVVFEKRPSGIRTSTVHKFVQEGLRRPRFELISVTNIENVSVPEFLIADLIPALGIGQLYGPPGNGKTFVALDWAACVAVGQ